MRKIILAIFAFGSIASASQSDFLGMEGDYQFVIQHWWRGDTYMNLRLGPLQKGKLGSIEIEHPELGYCTSLDLGDQYGYKLFFDILPTHNRSIGTLATLVYADVQCGKSHHILFLELPQAYSFSSGTNVEAGFAIKTGTLQTRSSGRGLLYKR